MASQGQTTRSAGSELLDLPRLEAYLGARMPCLVAPPLTLKQFSLGQSNPTFLLTDSKGSQLVLRKKPPGKIIDRSQHNIDREYTILSALKLHSVVPIPQVHLLCKDPEIIGTPFYIMQFISGRIFADPLLSNIPAKPDYYFAAILTLAEFHKVDFKKVGLESYGRSGGFYPRQLKRLLDISKLQGNVLSPSGTVGSLPHLESILPFFLDNFPPDLTTLIHGDYKFDNLIFSATSPKIFGILDWELSTLGHPLSDLCSFLGQYFFFPIPNDAPSLSQCVNWYCTAMEITRQDIAQCCRDHVQFGIAFALFKMSVIFQGIAARQARGQASSEKAEKIAQMRFSTMRTAKAIVEKGVDAAVGKGDLAKL